MDDYFEYNDFDQLDERFSSAINALLSPQEKLRAWASGFDINWMPFPYGNGVDQVPIVNHVWIAVTSEHLRAGQFVQQELPMTVKERWKFSNLPAGANKPVSLHPHIANHMVHPPAHISAVHHRAEFVGLPFWRDDYGNNWKWALLLDQLADDQIPKPLWLFKGHHMKTGQMAISLLGFSIAGQQYFMHSFSTLAPISDAIIELTERTSTHPQPVASSSLASEIEQLSELHRTGILSDEEFAAAKRRVIDGA